MNRNTNYRGIAQKRSNISRGSSFHYQRRVHIKAVNQKKFRDEYQVKATKVFKSKTPLPSDLINLIFEFSSDPYYQRKRRHLIESIDNTLVLWMCGTEDYIRHDSPYSPHTHEWLNHVRNSNHIIALLRCNVRAPSTHVAWMLWSSFNNGFRNIDVESHRQRIRRRCRDYAQAYEAKLVTLFHWTRPTYFGHSSGEPSGINEYHSFTVSWDGGRIFCY